MSEKCSDTLTPDDMTYECEKPAGHDGDHAARGGTLTWWRPPEPPNPDREEPR